MIYRYKVNIIPYVLKNGVVSIYHEKYRKNLKVTNWIEAYIQSKIKTLESISLDYRRKVSTVKREIVAVASIEPVEYKTECVYINV